jgi:hypothetical protein
MDYLVHRSGIANTGSCLFALVAGLKRDRRRSRQDHRPHPRISTQVRRGTRQGVGNALPYVSVRRCKVRQSLRTVCRTLPGRSLKFAAGEAKERWRHTDRVASLQSPISGVAVINSRTDTPPLPGQPGERTLRATPFRRRPSVRPPWTLTRKSRERVRDPTTVARPNLTLDHQGPNLRAFKCADNTCLSPVA